MFRCLDCGHVFEAGEESRWVERHGFHSGPYEKWSGCPLCRGAYEEVDILAGDEETEDVDDL